MEKSVEEDVQVENEGDRLNPWLTIWYKPRATFRSFINHGSANSKLIIFLVMLSGVLYAFDRAVGKSMGESMSTLMVLVLVIVLGAVGGIISWLIWSAIVYYVGKLFKGTGTLREMYTVIGLSYIPVAVSTIFCFFDVVILKDALFVDVYLSPFQIIWLLFSTFFTFMFTAWSWFLMVKGIAEVHRFSSWKGLLTFIIPGAVLFLMIIVIVIFGVIVSMVAFG